MAEKYHDSPDFHDPIERDVNGNPDKFFFENNKKPEFVSSDTDLHHTKNPKQIVFAVLILDF